MTVPSHGCHPDWMGLDGMIAQGTIKLARAPRFFKASLHVDIFFFSPSSVKYNPSPFTPPQSYTFLFPKSSFYDGILPKSDTLFPCHRNRESFGLFHPIRVF